MLWSSINNPPAPQEPKLYYPTIAHEIEYVKSISKPVETPSYVLECDDDEYHSAIHDIYMLSRLGSSELKGVELTDKCIKVSYSCNDSITLAQIRRSVPLSEFIPIMTNIIHHLKDLYERYNFTHYRLSPYNIALEGDKVILRDFDVAYAEFDDVKVGAHYVSEDDPIGEVAPNHYWVYDIFKLLCWTLHSCDERIKEYVEWLVSYFVSPVHICEFEPEYNAPRVISPPFDNFYDYFMKANNRFQ